MLQRITPRAQRWTILAAATLALLILAVPAQAQISVVVSAQTSQDVSEDDVKKYFSGSKLTWSDGSPVQIVDQPQNAIGNDFYQKLLNSSAAKVRVQWTKLVLSGQAKAPVKSANDAAVKATLATNPSAIGFISSDAVDDTVREVLRLE